jgi:hypothetical protein
MLVVVCECSCGVDGTVADCGGGASSFCVVAEGVAYLFVVFVGGGDAGMMAGGGSSNSFAVAV